MRLKTIVQKGIHTNMVTACCWDPQNEMYTISDDQTIHKWSMEGESITELAKLEAYATDMSWCPAVGKQRPDTFAVSCSDGTFRIMNSSGREEKKIEAHKNCAVISIQWSHDASAIVTSGEDGTVKVWSRVGMLRNTLSGNGHPVYCALWSPDDDHILYSGGRQIVIKALQKDRKQLQWNAHEKTVLSVDWNAVTNLIVSGGEDCRYRVWDSYGRQLYQSQPFDQVITAVNWSPNGEYFAVGSFNMLRLCDKTGWSYSREEVSCGSLLSFAWAADSTMVGGAGANGDVVFGQIVDRSVDWKYVSAIQSDVDQLQVTESLNDRNEDFVETLGFRDRVVAFAVAYEHVVVACATQIHVYKVENLNTPHILDVPKHASVNMLVLAQKYFCITDNIRGVTVYTYEGRKVSNPVFPGMRVEFLNSSTLSLSCDTIAILDRTDNMTIRLMDASSGRPTGSGKCQHNIEITEIHLSQFHDSFSRYIAFIDRNRDLYIAPVTSDANPKRVRKLHTMVDSVCWNDTSDMLVALADGMMVTWYYPQALWVDSDLVPLARVEKDTPEFGKLPKINSFYGNQVVVRHADGSNLTMSVSPYPAMLYDFVKSTSTRWEDAVRLCRLVDSSSLWATLAAMAIHGRHLDTAEIALAAINEVDKLHYILYIKEIPSEKGKMAELALYRRDINSAEQILLHASPPLVYRAIKMNIRMCRWGRALELASTRKVHVDTVLWYRKQYLAAHKLDEAISAYKDLEGQVEIDEEKVKVNKARERDAELRRYGGEVNDDGDEEEDGEDEEDSEANHK